MYSNLELIPAIVFPSSGFFLSASFFCNTSWGFWFKKILSFKSALFPGFEQHSNCLWSPGKKQLYCRTVEDTAWWLSLQQEIPRLLCPVQYCCYYCSVKSTWYTLLCMLCSVMWEMLMLNCCASSLCPRTIQEFQNCEDGLSVYKKEIKTSMWI